MAGSIFLNVLNVLVPQLVNLLPTEIVKGGLDKALDAIEDAVEKSESKLDDATILPLCSMIRRTLDIPDNDD